MLISFCFLEKPISVFFIGALQAFVKVRRDNLNLYVALSRKSIPFKMDAVSVALARKRRREVALVPTAIAAAPVMAPEVPAVPEPTVVNGWKRVVWSGGARWTKWEDGK